MNREMMEKILEDMKEFNLPYNICFGGSGEPMMHKEFYEIMKQVNDDSLIKTVFVETNGLYADVNYKSFLSSEGSKITTIVNINGYNSDTYKRLHGKDTFDKVDQNLQSLLELNEDTERVYVQVMKINETEPFLDSYYDYWEEKKAPIILQKQNIYLGKIDDRRYSDLSPINRVPCWHLQRDLYITSSGSVSFCKQDFDCGISSGTIGEKPLKQIWNERKEMFLNDVKQSYPKEPDCASCDEWYTFNL
jgi:spiro-SPASM protein